MAVEALGRIEPYFNSYVITEAIKAYCELAEINYEETIKASARLRTCASFAKDLKKVQASLPENIFTKEKYSKYVSLFTDKSRRKIEFLSDIQKYLFYSQISQNVVSQHYLEKLLIQLLGHADLEIRDQTIVLLNMLYDGVDWQFSEAFIPKVVTVDSRFSISETVVSNENLSEVVIMLSAPSYFKDCPLTVLTWHVVKVQPGKSKGEYIVEKKFKKFWRCGFYDWKIVAIGEGGKIEMLKIAKKDAEKVFAQGRFIVQPKEVAEQQVHELMVDYKDSEGDPERSFYTLSKEIGGYAKQGITSIYLLGALERDNGVMYDAESNVVREVQRPTASPLAITDRSCPNKMLGGERGFAMLMEEGKRAGLKMLVDCLTRVSSSRLHRKYRDVLLHTLDSDGKLTLCYGTDGRAIKYEDTAMLNYRKLKAWNLLIEDIRSFAKKYKIDGIHLDNGQAWPQIMEVDEAEMYRRDTDGKPAYTEKEILNGEVVIKNENHGYWNSTNVDTYANPMFIKLCRQLWCEFPEFYFIGECWGGYPFENRQGILARSGVIPRLFKLPIAIASLFGKRLQKDGTVTPCHPQNVNALKGWYEQNRKFLPEGAYLVQSSSSHSWPYPAHLYGRGTWSAVDLLFFMPDIPMTFMDEVKGSVFRRNTTNVYQAKPLPKQQLQRAKSQLRIAMEEHDPDEEPEQPSQKPTQPEETHKILRVKSSSSISALASSKEAKKKEEEVVKQVGPEFGFDLKKINLHYEHRRKLRSEKTVLRHGELVPLDAKHSAGWHSHVFAFARFSHFETAIIAINFTDSQVSFYIDFSNLLPYFKKHYHENTVVIFSDWIGEKNKDYYFLMELIKEKMPFTLPPFGSICKGIQICKDDPMVYAMSLEKSFLRLNSQVISGKDCSSAQPCQQLLEAAEDKKPLNDFAMILANLYKNYLFPHKIHMHVLLHRLHVVSEDLSLGAKLFAYCRKLISYKAKNPALAAQSAVKASEEMVLTNKLGPIVFMAPELGRWSTVGGLGVMVDELTQGLALVGEDVYVITPYYNVNRKGETWYLSRDPAGFSYYKNIHVKAAGCDFTIGVHRGEVNKVKLIFLHHADLFPVVYAEGGATYILRQISAFAKAALEYLCSEQFIPSLVVTNDWFTGLVAAYAKTGAFGDVFHGTTFLHIFHNLQELYEGRLYPNRSEGTLDHIHQLPTHLLVDFYWKNTIINPSRCATLCSDQWATVSPSYRSDLLNSSPLAPILRNHPRPFAFPNGIPIIARLKRLKDQAGPDHETAKRKLQQKYFHYQDLDTTVPVFAFVGRIVPQKGVHLICETAEHLIHKYGGKINILVGGPAARKDPYAGKCAGTLEYLARKYPNSVWAAPNEFFMDGPLVNLGADFGMMPSLFEPGGIVQHEFFVAGTPVVAFKTGGLKDTVTEFKWDTNEGSGFVFESYNHGDFIYAMERAIGTFHNKEKYNILRENARRSTMDGATVTRAWAKEFYRLRGKVFIDQELEAKELEAINTEWNYTKYNDSYIDEYVYRNLIATHPHEEAKEFVPLSELVKRNTKNVLVPTTFKISLGSKQARSVQLAGSFDNWKSMHPLNYDPYTNCWFVTLHLKKGKYLYRFFLIKTIIDTSIQLMVSGRTTLAKMQPKTRLETSTTS
eukprot:TRINITY_DN55_c0_g1_i1.p1 TRINITY_DN55_c0_g1~~TRINITY_DN55_c0_g1_i1.p1  ORF type:complete len:1631 (+),score=215.10 TRINITY_DN55_c0_g1_i1:3219-8111(+)